MYMKKLLLSACLVAASATMMGQSAHTGIDKADAHYLMSVNTIEKDMYSVDDDAIGILYKDGTIRDVAEASELLNVQLLSKKIRK